MRSRFFVQLFRMSIVVSLIVGLLAAPSAAADPIVLGPAFPIDQFNDSFDTSEGLDDERWTSYKAEVSGRCGAITPGNSLILSDSSSWASTRPFQTSPGSYASFWAHAGQTDLKPFGQGGLADVAVNESCGDSFTGYSLGQTKSTSLALIGIPQDCSAYHCLEFLWTGEAGDLVVWNYVEVLLPASLQGPGVRLRFERDYSSTTLAFSIDNVRVSGEPTTGFFEGGTPIPFVEYHELDVLGVPVPNGVRVYDGRRMLLTNDYPEEEGRTLLDTNELYIPNLPVPSDPLEEPDLGYGVVIDEQDPGAIDYGQPGNRQWEFVEEMSDRVQRGDVNGEVSVYRDDQDDDAMESHEQVLGVDPPVRKRWDNCVLVEDGEEEKYVCSDQRQNVVAPPADLVQDLLERFDELLEGDPSVPAGLSTYDEEVVVTLDSDLDGDRETEVVHSDPPDDLSTGPDDDHASLRVLGRDIYEVDDCSHDGGEALTSGAVLGSTEYDTCGLAVELLDCPAPIFQGYPRIPRHVRIRDGSGEVVVDYDLCNPSLYFIDDETGDIHVCMPGPTSEDCNASSSDFTVEDQTIIGPCGVLWWYHEGTFIGLCYVDAGAGNQPRTRLIAGVPCGDTFC